VRRVAWADDDDDTPADWSYLRQALRPAPATPPPAETEPVDPPEPPGASMSAKTSSSDASVVAEPRTTSRSTSTTSAPDLAALPDDWTAEELAEVRTELQDQATQLRGEIDDAESVSAAVQRDASGEGSGDEADAGSKTFEREHEMSLANNSRDLLQQVQRALARIDAGTYGRCESCGNAIPKPRLQAFPRATLCVSCKQREERR